MQVRSAAIANAFIGNFAYQSPSSPSQCQSWYDVRSNAECLLDAGGQLALHINETTVSFPFEPSRADEVTSAIIELLQTFKDKQAAERPKRWKPMDYKYKGTATA